MWRYQDVPDPAGAKQRIEQRSSFRVRSAIQAKNLLSIIAASLAFWLLLSRTGSEYLSSEFQIALLKVEAKCPGLPFGAYSGGPDYIDISIDTRSRCGRRGLHRINYQGYQTTPKP